MLYSKDTPAILSRYGSSSVSSLSFVCLYLECASFCLRLPSQASPFPTRQSSATDLHHLVTKYPIPRPPVLTSRVCPCPLSSMHVLVHVYCFGYLLNSNTESPQPARIEGYSSAQFLLLHIAAYEAWLKCFYLPILAFLLFFQIVYQIS